MLSDACRDSERDLSPDTTLAGGVGQCGTDKDTELLDEEMEVCLARAAVSIWMLKCILRQY
jgi:hypothetical protein